MERLGRVVAISLILAFIVFGSGIFLGYGFQKRINTQASVEIGEIRKEIDEMQTFVLFSTLNKNFTCQYYKAMIDRVGNRLESTTEKVIATEKDVHLLSEEEREELIGDLMNLRIQYWILAENYRKYCNNSYHTILYFYRVKPNCYVCVVQGNVLGELSKKCDVAVVPISLNVNITGVSLLASVYNVTLNDAPVIVLDGSDVRKGLISLKELNELCTQS